MHLIKIIGAKEFLQQKIGFFEVEYININSILLIRYKRFSVNRNVWVYQIWATKVRLICDIELALVFYNMLDFH